MRTFLTKVVVIALSALSPLAAYAAHGDRQINRNEASSNVNLVDKSKSWASVLPEYAPFMPDNGPMRHTDPFGQYGVNSRLQGSIQRYDINRQERLDYARQYILLNGNGSGNPGVGYTSGNSLKTYGQLQADQAAADYQHKLETGQVTHFNNSTGRIETELPAYNPGKQGSDILPLKGRIDLDASKTPVYINGKIAGYVWNLS